MGEWKLGHRPALDGLRGIAILLVLGAHAGVPGLNGGGTVGVCLFFALSGFLITGLLLQEHRETGSISLSAFYERRARRLLPALVAVTATVALVAVVVRDDMIDWRTLPAVLFYGVNWVVAAGGDLRSLGMTWTLGIEEQFYILWPALVLAVRTRSRVLLSAAVLCAGSLLLRIHFLAGQVPMHRILTGTDTVAAVILFGAVAVVLRSSGGPGRSRPALAMLLLTATLACVWLPNGPMGVLGQPLIGFLSALVLWACTGEGRLRALETRWLRWFGSRSYGIYLWHGPLMWTLWQFGLSWVVLTVVGIPVTLAVAEASYRWIEAPIQRGRLHNVRGMLPAAGHSTA